MPISRKEFERAELDPGLLVEEFLRANSEWAFTLAELMNGLASKYTLKELSNALMLKGAQFTEEDFQKMLSSLEQRGRIESKTIGDVTYYSYSETLGFKSP
jgi:hypothetical protein